MHIYVETYGCTANKSDEHLLLGLIKQNGHQIVSNIKDADVLVLLTCTVIGTTEQRMLSRLRLFQKTKKRIIISGCMPTVQADLLRTVTPTATLLPAQYIMYINEILEENTPAFLPTKKTSLPRYYTTPIAPLLIAEGCLLSCSYCITHLARGILRSFPSEEIVRDVCSALQQGCKEIQLTAQDTASYGLDTGTNLGALLKQISQLEGIFRIRIGMMNPATVQKNISSILAAYQYPNIYKFLHLPLQSGDNDILQKMNRGYTTDEFLHLVHQFQAKIPTMTLSTDIIIGFPSETDEQFNNTMTFIKTLQPDIINITRFSARPLTPAKNMKERIPTHIVKERSRQATEICAKVSYQQNKKHINKTYQVLVTEHGKKTSVLARADSYKQVVLMEPIPLGSIAHVQIVDATSTYLVGKLI
jgi:threonylcarbamoyladenosine tRNA methylthiotransferase CDKAL1